MCIRDRITPSRWVVSLRRENVTNRIRAGEYTREHMRLCRFGENRLGIVGGHVVRDVTPALDVIPASRYPFPPGDMPVSYTHLRAHETGRNLVCRLLLEK